MERTRTVRVATVCVLVLLVVGLVFASTTPALAWSRVNKIAYHFWAHNNTGGLVNDATVWGTVRNVALPWQPPNLQSAWSSVWPYTGTNTLGIWRIVRFGPGVALPPSSLVWFNVDFRTYKTPPVVSQAWLRWTWNTAQVGGWRWLGWRWGSDPSLYNPPERPDGTPNTLPMVVTNLQFAVSPNRIANDETTLDNPEVLSLFAASSDPVRPGPIVVVPDSFFDVVLDPSITEPEVDGSTVLATGLVEDEAGEPRPFVVQFIAEGAISTPASGPITIAILGVVGVATLCAFLLKRKATAAV